MFFNNFSLIKIGFIHSNFVIPPDIHPAGYTSYPAGYRIAEKLPDSAGYRIVTGYPARL